MLQIAEILPYQKIVFQWQEDINAVVISALSSTKPCLSSWKF